jgi:hypothetical protein
MDGTKITPSTEITWARERYLREIYRRRKILLTALVWTLSVGIGSLFMWWFAVAIYKAVCFELEVLP